MNRNVLVLNGGLPYQCWSWQDAVRNIFKKNCYVLEEYDDFILHASGGREIMKCPSVIMLSKYEPYSYTPKYGKDNVFQRDDFQCQYCGSFIENPREREIEHIVPKAHQFFPGSTFENTVLSCSVCNRQKGKKSLEEIKNEKCWNGKPFQLIKKPEAPENRVGYARFVAMVNKHRIAWLNYIPRWEYYAKRMGRNHLFDLYSGYINNKVDQT